MAPCRGPYGPEPASEGGPYLRHACASWLVAAGVPLPVVQAHLGHESIQTTIGVYGHLDRRSMSAVASAIEVLLSLSK